VFTLINECCIVGQQDSTPVRIEGYGKFVVPQYTEEVFKEHFRMHRRLFR